MLPSKTLLRSRKKAWVEKSLNEFQSANNLRDSDPKLQELRKNLEAEALRIFPMVDTSIFDERIKRSIVTFIITSAIGIAIIFGFGLFAIPFAPYLKAILSALTGAFASIATIGTSYEARVKAAFNSERVKFADKTNLDSGVDGYPKLEKVKTGNASKAITEEFTKSFARQPVQEAVTSHTQDLAILYPKDDDYAPKYANIGLKKSIGTEEFSNLQIPQHRELSKATGFVERLMLEQPSRGFSSSIRA